MCENKGGDKEDEGKLIPCRVDTGISIGICISIGTSTGIGTGTSIVIGMGTSIGIGTLQG